MIIKNIELINFKHFHDQIIELNKGLNVFIGENNAGKTSVLNAIAAIFRLGISENVDFDFPSKYIDGAFTSRINLSAQFTRKEWIDMFNIQKINVSLEDRSDNQLWRKLIDFIATNNYCIDFRLDITVTENNQNSRYSIDNNDIQIIKKINSEIIPGLLSEDDPNFGSKCDRIRRILNVVIPQISNNTSNLPFRPLKLFPYNYDFARSEKFIPFRNLKNQLRTNKKVSNIRAQVFMLKEKNPSKFEIFKERMIKNFQGIDNIDIVLNYDSGDLDLILDNFNRDITLYGGGTKTFATIFSILSLEEYNLILIDEPDVHIHSSLISSLYNYLSELSKTKQILITSHIPDLINLIPIEDLFSFEIKDGYIDVMKIENKSQLYMKMKKMGLISDLYQTLLLRSADMIVFCEGPTDEVYLEKFRDKVIEESNLNVKYLAIGRRHSTELIKIKNLIIELYGDKSILYIRDRDESTTTEINKLKSVGDFPVHIWERRHIESYLIDIEVIANLIKNNYSEMGIETITDSIKEIIDTEKLQQYPHLLYDYCENRIRENYPNDVERSFHYNINSNEEEILDHLYNALKTRKVDTFVNNVNKGKVEEYRNEYNSRWERESNFMVNAKKVLKRIRREFSKTNFTETDIIEKIENIPEELVQVLNLIYNPQTGDL